MASFRFLLSLTALAAILESTTSAADLSEEAALNFVVGIEEELGYWCNRASESAWRSGINITAENQKANMEVGIAYANYKKEMWSKVVQYPWKTFENKTMRRLFKSMSNIGTEALGHSEIARYINVSQTMQNLYGTAKVADYKDPGTLHSLTPGLEEILTKSQDYDELEYVWTAWRNASGAKMLPYYEEYVAFEEQAAKMNGYDTAYDSWISMYDTPNFKGDILKLWSQVEPLYKQLHAYIRKGLVKQYPGKIAKDGLIPAHLLGNMWGQNWFKHLNATIPFRGKASVDITPELPKQGYTPTKIFILADDFFSSIGFPRLPFSFWRDSILEKPNDGREMECHATAWDFCNAKDFRIRMCTQLTMKDLVTAHHEVGHNMYHMAYKGQIQYFRDGANDGFHEAIGDCIAYSVSTPKHLHKLGLLQVVEEDKEATINYLYKEALDKIAFLPMALVIDSWRWDVFQKKVSPAEFNCHWWSLRRSIQGFKPPNIRTSKDFDPGSKYHIPYGVPYVRYFISGIVQLQFHKALCEAAGEYDSGDPTKPLHNCDIYGSRAAGDKLYGMLKLGSSLPWQEALEIVTGEKSLNAAALLEYFQPLYDWLVEENKNSGEFIGWKDDGAELCVP